jgi:OOP family OmpA-OmpF porin
LLYAALLCAGVPGHALELSFSGPATLTRSEAEDFASYSLPVGPFQDGRMQTLVAEGPREKSAWKVESASGTTLGVADNLRRQIEAMGFELLYECETDACGGFDFRFETEVLPEPDMHVDLGDYRYLAAQRLGGAVPEYVSLFVSRSDRLGYVQLIRVGGQDFEPTQAVTVPAAQVAPSQPRLPLIDRLETRGSAVLQDLQFATGSSELTGQDYATLTTLADYLKAQPERTIALVGHTDAEGSLQGNIALSRQRARAAMQRLIDLGVPRAQLEADGVGYLAPMASNLTEEGRAKNRRVEAILTSTQ